MEETIRQLSSRIRKSCRQQRGEIWRKHLGTKTVRQRLGEVMPQVRKRTKSAGVAVVQKTTSTKLGAFAGKVFGKASKNKAKGSGKGKPAAVPEPSASAAMIPDGPLKGKLVRIIGWEKAGKSIRDCSAVVEQHKRDKVTVKVSGTSTVQVLPEQEVTPITGKEAAPLPEKVDFRKVSDAMKAECLVLTGGVLAFLKPDQLLEGGQLNVLWKLAQLKKQLSPNVAGKADHELCWLDPMVIESVQAAFEKGVHETDAATWSELVGGEEVQGSICNQLARINAIEGKCRILVPVHSYGPQHWTLLVLTRQP